MNMKRCTSRDQLIKGRAGRAGPESAGQTSHGQLHLAGMGWLRCPQAGFLPQASRPQLCNQRQPTD